MSGSARSKAPAAPQAVVVVRRKRRRGAAGHHGGSWKVAYADFVTAMMAFFLLLWLLGSTSQEQRDAISTYFKRPLKEVLSSGPESGGDRLIAVSDGGLSADSLAPGQLARVKSFDSLQTHLEEIVRSDSALRGLDDHIVTQITPDGMLIQLLDGDEVSMFEQGSAVPGASVRRLLQRLAPLIEGLNVQLLISGHTDAMPYEYGDPNYGNWELSTDRANAARRLLVSAGLSEQRLLRVDGHGPSSPLLPEDPHNPKNRRVSLFLLTAEAAQKVKSVN